jgi:hypothetical protein
MTMDGETTTSDMLPAARSSFWSRHLALINFWLDVVLAVLFLVQGWMFAVLHAVFPRGAGSDWTVWGATPLDWSELLFTTFCVFAVGVVLHVMLHWDWVCGIVATKILRRKTCKDDGSHTLLGVGTLLVLFHVLAAGILAARVALVGPQ